MELIFLNILAPVITGCTIVAFKHWLDSHNKGKRH
ncbi:type I toxin-antitoxin system Fst family toxin [Staphylococcus petrasii]